MKIALILYDRVSYFDFFGFYEIISRLKALKNDEIDFKVCALKDEIKDEKGLILKPCSVGENLSYFDIVFVAGGIGANVLQYDDIFLSWIKSAKNAKYKIATCSGMFIFGAAGFLKDKTVALYDKNTDNLMRYCKKISKKHIYLDNGFISSCGLYSGIEAGLFMSELLYDKDLKDSIKATLRYTYM